MRSLLVFAANDLAVCRYWWVACNATRRNKNAGAHAAACAPAGSIDIILRGLERVTQRELDQPRRAHCGKVSAEGSRILHIRDGRIRKVRVVPNVEEVRREPQLLPLGDLDVLEQREVPVLLVRTPIDIPAQVCEQCHYPITAVRGAQLWIRREIVGIQVAIVNAAMNVTARCTRTERAPRRQLRARCCCL